MSDEIKDETQPVKETIHGEGELKVKCSRILSNRMQCPRLAVVGKFDDPENREALCSVCFTMEGMPINYQKEIK